jgi:hypothetical protein
MKIIEKENEYLERIPVAQSGVLWQVVVNTVLELYVPPNVCNYGQTE